MSGHEVDTNKVWDYFEMDKEMEKVHPINPFNESRITASEIKIREARFYNYKKLWEWKRNKILLCKKLNLSV